MYVFGGKPCGNKNIQAAKDAAFRAYRVEMKDLNTPPHILWVTDGTCYHVPSEVSSRAMGFLADT